MQAWLTSAFYSLRQLGRGGTVLREWLHGLIAQTAAAAGDAASSGGSPLAGIMFPMVLIFGVMYFLIIRPQQQQAKKQQQHISQLKKGDEVLLQNGFFGKIFEVRTDDLLVELAPNMKVRVLKSAVVGPAPVPPSASTKADTKTEAEKKS
jgi:preprotein translocase subunit YajC